MRASKKKKKKKAKKFRCPEVNGVCFKLLLQQELYDVSDDKRLHEKLNKAFYMSLTKHNESESVFVRQHAYSLIFAIEQSDIKNEVTQEYESALKRSAERY